MTTTMRVLVTGATGFVGRALVARLVAAGHAVGAAVNDDRPVPPAVERFAVDIRDRAAVDRAMAAFRPESVVHLAALSHVGESWRRIPDYFAINVQGAENVLRATPAGVPALFMSSAEVYGLVPDDEQPIAEERPAAPRTPYALTKAAAERLALATGATVVRSFNLIGAGQAPNFALPDFARQLARIERREGEPRLAVGNLSPRRDFVHVDDAAEAIARLVSEPAPGEVLNLASGESPSIAEMLERLVALAGLEVEIVEDPARLRPVDVPRLCGDGAKLAARGFRPRRGVELALADLWNEARAEAGSAA